MHIEAYRLQWRFSSPLLPPLCDTISRDSMAKNEAFFCFFCNHICCEYFVTLWAFMKSQFCAVLSVVISLYVKVLSLKNTLSFCAPYILALSSLVPVHLLPPILLVEDTLHMSLELPLLSFLISTTTATSVLQPAHVPTRWFYRAMLCIRGTSHGSVSVCLSVCLTVRPSVTSRSSTKTAKRRITQITPHDSPGTLVFWTQRSPRSSTGVTPYKDDKCRWGGSKSATFHK